MIASNIKLIKFKQLIESYQVIFSALESDAHLEYQEDAQIINNFKFPSNTTAWCIRVVFDKIKLYMNRVSIAEIKERL